MVGEGRVVNNLIARCRSSAAFWPTVAVILIVGYFVLRAAFQPTESTSDYRWAIAEEGVFRQTLRRVGTLKPAQEDHIISKVNGVILELVPQGKLVAKNDVVLKLDPTPHLDAKAGQESTIRQMTAENRRQTAEAGKTLNQAREDIASYKLRVELEEMRLAEMKKGPGATDVINARTNLENNRNLFQAKEDEYKVLEGLAEMGYASREEVRQKKLEMTEQRHKVVETELALKKLYEPDVVKLADQELKVRDMRKNLEAAQERARLLEKNMQRDAERFKQRADRENFRLKDLEQRVQDTIYSAPNAGVVVHKKSRWYAFAPGREVNDGVEVLGLPNLDKMKVALTIDEARIAQVRVGQTANVYPAGWTGAPFSGKVTKVAEKGRDEFELYLGETTAIYGTANRQVFDVEVEVEGKSSALRPGLRAEVELVVQELERAVQVPRMAVKRLADGRTVVKLEAEERAVNVLGENKQTSAVEGVKPGERIRVIEN